MDDPWGSPWATDENSSIPTINLPAAPPPATLSSKSNSPRVSISAQGSPGASPWHNEDDAWGGWAEGSGSPGWGRSPGLRPAVVRERDVSPGPWLGRRGEGDGERERKLSVPEPQDAWKHDDKVEEQRSMPPEVEESSASEAGSSTRSESPDIAPPGLALRTEDRPEPVRSASKVQELVDMYDGIAKKSVSPAQSALVSPPPQEPGIRDSDDEEWGDVAALPTVASPIKASTEDLPPIVLESKEAEVAPTSNGWPEDATAEAPASTSPPRKSPIPDTKYAVDLSHLDSLFPSTPPISVSPEPLPDTIIDDTFASISERKTWYRVSRFGSMRKHNTGNDENYMRMDWAHSAARDKSLRIVRRWMEEDSIAGRVSLGARHKGAIGGSMFNWNSKAEPVDVGELLNQNKGHQRGGSKGSRGSKGEMASPVGATFGWSSQTTSPTGPSFPKPFEPRINGMAEAKTRPQSLIMPPRSGVTKPLESPTLPKTRPKSLIMPPPQAMNRPSIDTALATSSPTANRNSPLTASKTVEEDDDDWGEMVTSPTLPTAGSFTTTDHSKKPLDPKITSPSAASFGWDVSHGPSNPSEQSKSHTKTQSRPNSMLGWDDLKPPSQNGKVSSDRPQSPLKTEAASFGWDDFEKPSQDGKPSLEKATSPLRAEVRPDTGLEDFEKPLNDHKTSLEQPKSPSKPVQPATSMFGWDDFEKPSQNAQTSKKATSPLKAEMQPDPGLDDSENPPDDHKTSMEQPQSPVKPDLSTTSTLGWDDFEKQEDVPKADVLDKTRPSAATFEWDDFEKPSQDVSKSPVKTERPSSMAMSGWDDPPSFATIPGKTPTATQPETETIVSSTDRQKPMSPTPTRSSPLSPPLQATSLPRPAETPKPPLSQPHAPKTHTRTPSQTKKDEETVARILNDLPDLSYMLR